MCVKVTQTNCQSNPDVFSPVALFILYVCQFCGMPLCSPRAKPRRSWHKHKHTQSHSRFFLWLRMGLVAPHSSIAYVAQAHGQIRATGTIQSQENVETESSDGMEATGKVSVSFRLASLFCPVQSERSLTSRPERCWLTWLRLYEGCHTIQLSGPAERTGFPSAPLALPICH